MSKVIIYVDGAARGNPGPASIAAVIKDKQGKTITTISRRIGISTNNQAEYKAIMIGLERAISLDMRFAEVRSDSELVVRQILGTYHVRNSSLLPLYRQVKQLKNALEGFTIKQIPREQNNEANNLAKRTLNLVRHINYAHVCQLIIKIKQSYAENNDISFLSQLISILRNFPGSDLVKLNIGSKDKYINLKLSNMRVNYCHELREELIPMLGKRNIIIKQPE